MEIIHVTSETRFVALNDRTVDVLSGGETYTIEREVNEVSGFHNKLSTALS
jgi:hypothetical protein